MSNMWSSADSIELHPNWGRIPDRIRTELLCIQNNDTSVLRSTFRFEGIMHDQNVIYSAYVASVCSALVHNSVLTSLNISGNNIDDAGAASLCSVLAHNSVLTSLNLSRNRICAVGAASVCSALERNSVLTSLNLFANNIGYAGAASVCSALEHHSVLMSFDIGGNISVPSVLRVCVLLWSTTVC